MSCSPPPRRSTASCCGSFYVVPQWTYGKVRTARWDRFGRPHELPKYGAAAFPTVWWWDAEKAAKTGTRQ